MVKACQSRVAVTSTARSIFRPALILPIVMVLASAPAIAGNADSGRALAERWCTSCHLIGPSDRGSDTAPPFAAIAADPEKTPGHLTTWLSTPHTTMPQMPLDRQNIDDLVAYIGSLAP